jgi:hypothetical protein
MTRRVALGEEMTCWPVSPRVGSVKNNDPSLVEPITVTNLIRRLAALFVICARRMRPDGSEPRTSVHAPHSPDNTVEYPRDRGGGGGDNM